MLTKGRGLDSQRGVQNPRLWVSFPPILSIPLLLVFSLSAHAPTTQNRSAPLLSLPTLWSFGAGVCRCLFPTRQISSFLELLLVFFYTFSAVIIISPPLWRALEGSDLGPHQLSKAWYGYCEALFTCSSSSTHLPTPPRYAFPCFFSAVGNTKHKVCVTFILTSFVQSPFHGLSREWILFLGWKVSPSLLFVFPPPTFLLTTFDIFKGMAVLPICVRLCAFPLDQHTISYSFFLCKPFPGFGARFPLTSGHHPPKSGLYTTGVCPLD